MRVGRYNTVYFILYIYLQYTYVYMCFFYTAAPNILAKYSMQARFVMNCLKNYNYFDVNETF